MHIYPLHHPISIPCECCRLASDFTFTSSHEHAICRGCARHQGSGDHETNIRHADHEALYWSEIQCRELDHQEALARQDASSRAAIERRDRQIVALEANRTELAEKIEELKAVLRTGDIDAATTAWLAEHEVEAAHRERESIRHDRDRVFQTLWRASLLHRDHDKRPHYCLCGKHVDQCREYRAIESELATIVFWEGKQLDLYRNGEDHHLSDEYIIERGLRRRARRA